MAHVRQSGPDSGLGFHLTVLETFTLFPLRSEADQPRHLLPFSAFSVADAAHRALSSEDLIGILLPNNQRQHRTWHIQKDVLPYALCYRPNTTESRMRCCTWVGV